MRRRKNNGLISKNGLKQHDTDLPVSNRRQEADETANRSSIIMSPFRRTFATSVLSLITIVSAVGPLCYAQGGSHGFLIGTSVSVTSFTLVLLCKIFRNIPIRQLAANIISIIIGLEFGLAIPYVLSEPLGLNLGIVLGAIMGSLPPLLWTAIFYEQSHNDPRFLKFSWVFVKLTSIFYVVVIVYKYKLQYINVPALNESTLFTQTFITMASAITVDLVLIRPSIWIGTVLSMGVGELIKLGVYFRILGPSLLGFVVGYLVLGLLFASWYWAAWTYYPHDPVAAFGGDGFPDKPDFSTFLYFSFVTLGTLGYGDITPKIALTKILVCSQLVFGVGWITVIFALVVARFQNNLSRVIEPVRDVAATGERSE